MEDLEEGQTPSLTAAEGARQGGRGRGSDWAVMWAPVRDTGAGGLSNTGTRVSWMPARMKE